jgi:hypothetical protein
MGAAVSGRYGGLGLPYSDYLEMRTVLSRASADSGLLPAINVLVARSLER